MSNHKKKTKINHNSKIPSCKRNIHFLKYIHSIPKNKRNNILKKVCSHDELNSIIEIFFNFLNKNIPCKNSFIKYLKKYSSHFFKITKKSNSNSIRRKLLTSKTGGFLLTTLLNIAIPLLSKLYLN